MATIIVRNYYYYYYYYICYLKYLLLNLNHDLSRIGYVVDRDHDHRSRTRTRPFPQSLLATSLFLVRVFDCVIILLLL